MINPKNNNQEAQNAQGTPLQDRFSPEYMAYLKELEGMGAETHAKQIAKMARDGKIEPEVLKEVRETLRDPNKMEKKEYRHFMKALGQGKFPQKSKHALRFLQALDGTEKEKDLAEDFLKNLSEESTSALTERREKNALKKLTDLREEDLTSQTISQTSTAANTITASAGIKSRIEDASKSTTNNWRMEKVPEALVEELDRLEIEQAQIAAKSNAIDEQYRAAQSAKNPDKNLIERLKQELRHLDEEFDKLEQKLKKPRLEYQQWLTRNLARYRALEEFFKRAGVDVRTAERLRMWFIDLSRANQTANQPDNKKASLKLMGINIDPVSGVAKKQETTIEIKSLSFDVTDRNGIRPDAAGELLIEYVNEKGETKVEGYKNFLAMLTAFEGYEEIDSLAELNERSTEELAYADLAVGQEFETEVLVGFDDKNQEIKQKRSFKIEAIDENKKSISLDQTVTKTPRQKFGLSLDASLYFDRKQKDFSFGEFAKFLKQYDYQRKVHVDETATICEKAGAHVQAKCAEFVKDSSEKSKARFASIGGTDIPKMTVPKTGETKEVLYLDENERVHWGTLQKDGESYVLIETDRMSKTDAGVEDMLAAGVHSNFAYANRAPTAMYAATTARPSKRLTPLELARMVRDGTISDAPATRPGKNGRWELREQPNQIAAMSMAQKHDVGGGQGAHGADGGHDAPAAHDAHGADGGHGAGAAHGEHDEHDKAHAKKKYYEEALPLEAVKKSGGMKHTERGFVRALWTDTRFLSMSDFFEMGKAMWEFYDRRWVRRQKDKYARVGEELPYFSPEMRRIVESTEHEEVHQYQEAFEHKGIYEIQFRLENTTNKDEFKAAFVTLSDKGQLRWDSIPLWRNINKFISTHAAPIPIPTNGDPYTRISKDDRRTGFDFLKGAIDSIWGESTYDGWYSKNKSAYASNAKGFYEEGKQLEGVDGGHELRLSTLLRQHKEGIYVNPHEYEGLILHSIEAGKSNMQSKIYFMIEGVAAANADGRTIMSFDRIAHINSELLNNFPILEYICASVPRGPDGEEKFRWTLDDYRQWASWFDQGDPSDPTKFAPGTAVDEFMWKYVIPSDETENRINKALRNGEKLDHDDMFAYLPPASEGVLTDACKATTGSKKFLTVEGYANAFPGFSQYLRSTAETGRLRKLREGIKSYVRFEGIMTSRFDQQDDAHDSYQRMKYSVLNSPTICSNEPPQAFMDQMNAMIKKIIDAYDDPELNEIAATIYQPRIKDFTTTEGRAEQNKVNLAFREFGDVFTRVVKRDNGQKMQAITAEAALTGMGGKYISSEEKAKRKAQYSDALALD